jgi:uncharacterized membrane protein required for colicin V production
MFINLILDSIILTFLVLGCIIGAKKGFVYQFLSFFSYIISFIIAKILSKIASAWIYTTFIQEKIETTVLDKISTLIPEESLHLANTEQIKNVLINLLNDIPNFISDIINLDNIDINSLPLNSISEFSTAIVSIVLAPTIILLISYILFIFLFIILAVLVKIIINKTKVINKIPIIKTFNKITGAIFGFVKYGIIVFVFVQIFGLLLLLSGPEGLFGITEDIVQSTYLFKIFYNIF